MAFTKETLKHFWEHIDFLKANKDDVISVDLTNNDIGIASKNIFDLIYPVGSYYWSKNSTSPNELFGGVWEQVKDTFILAAGDNYSVGAVGGEAEHMLTVDEIAEHSHAYTPVDANIAASSNKDTGLTLSSGLYGSGSSQMWNIGSSVQYTGGNQPHNNMPPYRVAYCWCRVG